MSIIQICFVSASRQWRRKNKGGGGAAKNIAKPEAMNTSKKNIAPQSIITINEETIYINQVNKWQMRAGR